MIQTCDNFIMFFIYLFLFLSIGLDVCHSIEEDLLTMGSLNFIVPLAMF